MKIGKSARRLPKPPARSEIGQIGYEETKFRAEWKDRSGNPVKDRAGNVLTQERSGVQFFLMAVGPRGRYRARSGRPFDGKTSVDNASQYVALSDDAEKALNELIQELWRDGWQPTSVGRRWHDINFRRPAREAFEQESPLLNTTGPLSTKPPVQALPRGPQSAAADLPRGPVPAPEASPARPPVPGVVIAPQQPPGSA